jgi:predicted O-methyltransferase YrrM
VTISWRAYLKSLARYLRAGRSAAPLWVAPGHYYSPIPPLAQTQRDSRRIWDTLVNELPGIDLHEADQLALFADVQWYAGDVPLRRPGEDAGLRYSFPNDFFPDGDAALLCCMLRHLRPRHVIEVGSGYSSAMMLDTNDLFLDGGVSFTFIEPYPQRLFSLLRSGDRERTTVLRYNVQQAPLELFDTLAAGDILFIDSSHVARTGGDVNFLLFDVLPRLRPGVYVHIHDVFYPFEYPRAWVTEGRAWNEAYILRAFLQYNSAFRIALFSNYLLAFHLDTVQPPFKMCQQLPSGSIWLVRC